MTEHRHDYEPIPITFSVRRGKINEWGRQEVTVLLGTVETKTWWVPKDWRDDKIVAGLLFGFGDVVRR